MKKLTAALTQSLFLAAILVASTAMAQDDIEDPNMFQDVWYRIALDEDGTYLLGDGDGYAGGTWYYYPEADGPGWWRQWFYNGPCDSNRKGQLDYAVYIKAIDRSLQTSLEVRFNWATADWSALEKRRPPLPTDAPTPELQEKYMQGWALHHVDNWFIGTVEPIKSHAIADYNPQWVSIDVRGHNAYVYRGAHHLCLPKDPAMGACYDEKTGDCFTGYKEQCQAPYLWLGAGSSCSEYVNQGPFPVPVYRFWSPVQRVHFFTTSEREKDRLLVESEEDCTFEGIGYCALMDDTDPACRPVHRFWSEKLGVYFFTIVEAEKDRLERLYSHVWAYDGPAFYAYPEGHQPDSAVPVYRFWSGDFGYHFYTISEAERDWLIANFPHVWAYEGIAWYAFQP